MKPQKYSFEALDSFLQYAANTGLMKTGTAKGYRSALSKIQDTLTEAEAADVRKIEPDVVFQRFVNRNQVQISTSSLLEYKRRLSRAIEQYLDYEADPIAYKPRGRDSQASQKRRTKASRSSSKSTTTPNDSVQHAPDSEPERRLPVLNVPYPLRAEFVATVQIPRDMTTTEAERLAAFVRTLAVDFDPTKRG